jgi:ADP-ribose pyrophosphatase YjhB (NUDIX family)
MPTDERSTADRFQDVVTVFLTHRDKVLVLKRSSTVGTYRGHWAGVSGYLESDDPLKQAYTEMAEEVGLSKQDVTLLKAGKHLEIVDDAQDRAWRVYPFLFAVHEPNKIRLDWENRAMRWILPEEIDQLKTVPALKETLDRVIGDG